MILYRKITNLAQFIGLCSSLKWSRPRTKSPFLALPATPGSNAAYKINLGLLKRRQLMKVAQELKEAHIPWQVGFADTPKHPQIGLQQRKEALRPILMHVIPCVLFLRVIDKVVHIALERAI